MGAMVAHLEKNGHKVIGSAIIFGAGRPLPDLAATLRSHALIHTAEGEFFREVLISASQHCTLPLTKVKEREIWESSAALFKLGAAEIEKKINALGRSLGPPWRQDEKLAALAGWIALAQIE